MKLLIVEDEKKAAAYLEKGLCESGYTVDIAGDGENGLRLARTGEYALIILDVLLPKRDGWTVMQELRSSNVTTPVLFLSACDTVQDRVHGLELGADDYLIKPFAFSELLARVKSIIRRGLSTSHPETLCIANLKIDLIERKVFRGGNRLDLTPKEFMLLALLARRTGETLSRDLISEQVWEMEFNNDTNVVDVHVRRLRVKVDDPYEQKLIHTGRGVGYVLEVR